MEKMKRSQGLRKDKGKGQDLTALMITTMACLLKDPNQDQGQYQNQNKEICTIELE